MRGKVTNAKPLAKFYQADANFIAERIGELHGHAVLHEGEPCSQRNRSRIGGMIEVLSRMGLEVVCNWDRYDRGVIIMTDTDFIEHKRLAKESK